jgi:hypothetical protein
MAHDTFASLLKFLESLQHSRLDAQVAIGPKHIAIIGPGTAPLQLEAVDGSIIRGATAGEDQPFAKPTTFGGTLERTEAVCAFITQCEHDQDLSYNLTAGDYNNLGCAYIWCECKDHTQPSKTTLALAETALLNAQSPLRGNYNMQLTATIDQNLKIVRDARAQQPTPMLFPLETIPSTLSHQWFGSPMKGGGPQLDLLRRYNPDSQIDLNIFGDSDSPSQFQMLSQADISGLTQAISQSIESDHGSIDF